MLKPNRIVNCKLTEKMLLQRNLGLHKISPVLRHWSQHSARKQNCIEMMTMCDPHQSHSHYYPTPS